MSVLRIIGIALLVVGVVLFITGMSATGSFADKVSNFFTGKYTDNTAWYIYGGIGVGVVGLLLSAFGGNAKTS